VPDAELGLALGAIVLRQVPSPAEIAGIALVALGIAVHKPAR
jgi:hypothetical protein